MPSQHYTCRIYYLKFTKPLGEVVFIAVLPAQWPWVLSPPMLFFLFISNKYLDLKSTRIRVDLSFLRSEFARNLLGIHLEFTRTRILPFRLEYGQNGRNLVGMSLSQKWNLAGFSLKINSYQIPTNPTKFRSEFGRNCWNAWGSVKYSQWQWLTPHGVFFSCIFICVNHHFD